MVAIYELERIIGALDSIASELERLRLLREHELRAHVEHRGGDPIVVEDGEE